MQNLFSRHTLAISGKSTCQNILETFTFFGCSIGTEQKDKKNSHSTCQKDNMLKYR